MTTSAPIAAEIPIDGVLQADIIIIGAGIAGLFAAHNLPAELSVIVVDKGSPTRSGSSPWAQGGMAVAVDPSDSPELHTADTMLAGDGLCDLEAVRVLTSEAPERLAELIALGAEFDALDPTRPPTIDNLHLAREGAQTAARSVHRADATGAEMVRALRVAVAPRVRRLQGQVVQLGRSEAGHVAGVWVLYEDRVLEVRGRAVLLATGGCGGIFAATTNQDGATGDGVVLAHHAGAAVRDLAFVQFHPTGLAAEGNWRFLLSEALRGAGATLHDADGHRFMFDFHPAGELAPRHVVASAILAQTDGRAWLDATHLGAQALEREFPTVLRGARELGYDLATERAPVTPAAHYLVGGVR
ncbi:MAG: L-aspartate oxidase, partial [Glaciecola sp.]